MLKLTRPHKANYDVLTARQGTLSTQVKLASANWAQNGFGTPQSVLIFYIIKMLLFIGVWFIAIVLRQEQVDFTSEEFWFSKASIIQAFAWAMCFELLGFGCGSGPLTGRYLPPIGGVLYFSRLGTIRRSPFKSTTTKRRNFLDILIYWTFIFSLQTFLWMPDRATPSALTAFLLTYVAMGLRDQTVFLAGRPEHYLCALFCFAWNAEWMTGLFCIQMSLWLWAAVSKLTPHFPYVITVMASNAPYKTLKGLRKHLYASIPLDLRPSKTAIKLAHFGTVVEFFGPLFFCLGPESVMGIFGIAIMICFHIFILCHFPMGVPLEWNLVMIFGALCSFFHFDAIAFSTESASLLGILTLPCFVIPLIGNLYPRYVSFLPSMRYYAGNWAYTMWLVKPEHLSKIRAHCHIPYANPFAQIERLFDDEVAESAKQAVLAFRCMHLHGRELVQLLETEVSDLSQYSIFDGEMMGGWILGWNFGDGHLHNQHLIKNVFGGEVLRADDVFLLTVESQPLQSSTLQWGLYDGCGDRIMQGIFCTKKLRQKQPWDTDTSHSKASDDW